MMNVSKLWERMSMKKKLIIVVIWILSIYLLKQTNLLSLDMDGIQQYISGNKRYAMLLFITLWLVRLLIFIPGFTLMILGGICFDPMIGFLLSMAGMVLSETVVFIISRISTREIVHSKLERKHSHLKSLLDTYNYKFLALGIVCPFAPTDVICFLSAAVGLNFSTYILTILISNIPMILLYSLIGTNLNGSLISVGILTMSLIMVGGITIRVWRNLRLKTQVKLG